MNFLKNLFSGIGDRNEGDRGVYFYVRPYRCDQLVKVRVDPMNDLSREENNKGYFVRKLAQATRCPFPSEVTVRFDKMKRVISKEIDKGDFVTEAEYEAWLAEKEGSPAE